MTQRGETRNTREKACPNLTLSIKNPTQNDLESISDLGRKTPMTNRLSHGTTFKGPKII
jgi:hypothetical protein